MSLLMPEQTWYSPSFTRFCACIDASFYFYKCYFFVINPCGPYSRLAGAESCVKVSFGSFGSIRTNLRSIIYLVCQKYCYCFRCLVVCCISKKGDKF